MDSRRLAAIAGASALAAGIWYAYRRRSRPHTSESTKLFDRLDAEEGTGPADESAATACEMNYGMWLVPVSKLLALERLEPHQEMLRRGALVEYRATEHAGRVIFVSHQWAGWDQPDPDNEQLVCLQRVLRRMMSGEIDRIQTHWMEAMLSNSCKHITAEEMARAVPHMYVWIDYACIPQPSAGPMPSALTLMAMAQGDGEAEESESSGWARMADHRSDAGVGALLSAAVESIPAYVEQSALMLVLVPPCKHADRKGELVSKMSWRGRGWCRLEFQAAMLSRRTLRVMVVQGAEARPYFVFATEALNLTVGEGSFTCCTRNHDFGDGPGTVDCDKVKAALVIEDMLSAKMDDLFKQKRWLEARYFVAMSKYLRRGLEGATVAVRAARREQTCRPCADVSSKSVMASASSKYRASLQKATSHDGEFDAGTVSGLKAKLRWRGEAEEEAWAKETGTSLLWWATFSDDLAALRTVLAASEGGGSCEELLRRGPTRTWHALSIWPTQTALHTAMSYARPAVVEALLDAGASPIARTGGDMRFEPVHMAVYVGAADNIEAWARRFPDWDWERPDGRGHTAIHLAGHAPHGLLTIVKTLLAAGAKVDAIHFFGGNLLTSAVQNGNMTPDNLRALLALPQVRAVAHRLLRRPVEPVGWKMDAIFMYTLAQIAYRMKISISAMNGILLACAEWHMGRPLNHAVLWGNVDLVHVLLQDPAGGADLLELRDGLGMTPLEEARLLYGASVTRGLTRGEQARLLAKLADVPLPAAVQERLMVHVAAPHMAPAEK